MSPAIACQSLPGQDVLLSTSRSGDDICYRCYVLRTDTHEAAISEPTCATYQVLDVLPPQSTAAIAAPIPTRSLIFKSSNPYRKLNSNFCNLPDPK